MENEVVTKKTVTVEVGEESMLALVEDRRRRNRGKIMW